MGKHYTICGYKIERVTPEQVKSDNSKWEAIRKRLEAKPRKTFEVLTGEKPRQVLED